MTFHDEQVDRREPASVGTSFRQQFWLVGASGRWLYPIVALLGLMLLLALSRPSFSLVAAILAIIAAALWPTILWYNEAPSRRAYHWSMPVARPAQDLMRVAVGLLYLLGMCALFAAAGAIGDGSLSYFTGGGAQAWAGFFLIPVVAYLLMSPIALWSDYPVTRRTMIGVVLFGFFGVLADSLLGIPWLVRVLGFFLADGRWSFAETMTDSIEAMYRGRADLPMPPSSADWIVGPAIWITIGVAATLFAAAFRPDDIKRRLSSRSRAATPSAA